MERVKYYSLHELPEIIKNLSEDKKYTIIPQKKRRSIPQNSLLHMYFQIISDRFNELGDAMTPELLKEVLKIKLGIKFERKGEMYPKPTSDYTTVEMKQFIDNMQTFCRDYLEFELPNPDDQRLLTYYQENYK